MIIFLIVYTLITMSALIISGVMLGKALEKVDIFKTEKMPMVEIIIQGVCCIALCSIPLLNIWFLGYLIYHRKSLVDRSVHWIIIASEYSEK